MIKLMHSKLYKAKLITNHDNLKLDETSKCNQKGESIHAYFGMLQHIFQRNRHMIKELKLSGKRIQQCQQSKEARNYLKDKRSDCVRSISKSIERQPKESSENIKNTKKTLSKKNNKSSAERQEEFPMKNLQQLCYFVPIGQASRNPESKKEIQRIKQLKTERNCRTELSPLNENSSEISILNQISIKVSKPKLNRRNATILFKPRAPSNEETYHSSIRSSQRTNCSRKQSRHSVSVKYSQAVAPW